MPFNTPTVSKAVPAVDPNANWLSINRGIESNYNPYAKNPRSSAYGPDQFIKSTWLNLAKKYRPDLYNSLDRKSLLDKRSDPKLSAEFVGYNNKENQNYLTSKGADWNNVNASLAHRFGPSMTMRLLSADPNAPIDSLVNPQVMSQNPDLRGKTVSDVITGYQDKMQQSNTGAKQAFGVPPIQAAMEQPTIDDAGALAGVTDANPMQTAMQADAGDMPQAPTGGGLWGRLNKDNYLKKALIGAGAGLSSIDNPGGAAVSASMLKDLNNPDEWGYIAGKDGSLYRINKRTGGIDKIADGSADTTAFDDAASKSAAKQLEEVGPARARSEYKLQNLKQLKAYLADPNVYSGPAGEQVNWLKSIGKTMGWGDIKGVDEASAAQAISNRLALALRSPTGPDGGLTGNTSDRDLKFLKAGVPGIDKQPGANTLLIDYGIKLAERNQAALAEKAKYLAHAKTTVGLDEHMQEWVSQQPDLFADQPGFEEAQKKEAPKSGAAFKASDYF